MAGRPRLRAAARSGEGPLAGSQLAASSLAEVPGSSAGSLFSKTANTIYEGSIFVN